MAERKPVISWRVPKHVKEQIEAYQEENDISEADALRDLVQMGLRYDELEADLQSLEEIESEIDELEQQVRRVASHTEELSESSKSGSWWKFWR